MKQFGVKTCHKEDYLTILNYTLPIYYKVDKKWTPFFFNLVYKDGLVLVEYSTKAKTKDLHFYKSINTMDFP